jgi:hypothetical protein
VSLADLKARMGHDSVRAAMIYQHAAAEADQKIASTLDQRIGNTRYEPRVDARDRGSTSAKDDPLLQAMATIGSPAILDNGVLPGGAKGT